MSNVRFSILTFMLILFICADLNYMDVGNHYVPLIMSSMGVLLISIMLHQYININVILLLSILLLIFGNVDGMNINYTTISLSMMVTVFGASIGRLDDKITIEDVNVIVKMISIPLLIIMGILVSNPINFGYSFGTLTYIIYLIHILYCKYIDNFTDTDLSINDEIKNKPVVF